MTEPRSFRKKLWLIAVLLPLIAFGPMIVSVAELSLLGTAEVEKFYKRNGLFDAYRAVYTPVFLLFLR